MSERTRFVAEVSSNHHSDLARCLAFVDRPAEIGCYAVKFQLFRIDSLFAPEILAASASHRARRDWELPTDFLPALAARAHDRGIAFACTPFDLDAVAQIEPYVDFYKIASYELLWHPLLVACARTGKPVVLSTGMATQDEVEAAFDAFASAGGRDLVLLHCISGYPTPAGQCNLAALGALRGVGARALRVRLRVGWSDHSVEPGVVQRAIHAHAASMVEFHLDLDGQGAEFASGPCWLPEPMAELIRQVRAAELADGTGKKSPAPCERADRNWRADPTDGLRPLRALRALCTGWPQ